MLLRRTSCLLARFVLASLLSIGQAAPPADLLQQEGCRASRPSGAMWNLPFPTLGGRQLWADLEWRAGWRIQRHVWTGHHRLLDGGGVRRAWGSLEACRGALDEQAAKVAVGPRSERLVVLVHGLGRTRFSWGGMQAALEAEGFQVLDLAYPSTRGGIEEHAAGLAQLLNRLEGVREVSFVTHSMGGIVVRALFAREDPWRERITLGRIVMLAPPNQGARAAEVAGHIALVATVLGPALAELEPGRPCSLPVPPAPVLILRGERARGLGWMPWLPGADDGIVAAEESRLEGASERAIAPCIHTCLPQHRGAVAATVRFLR